ncbi:MAG: lipase family protein [candidate division NC10 bacterium]|nr:lipase family protein [candidate division NC10 bacterium]MDE2320473.1 lipase family protein [candidate division NC10 bacterium]
MSRRLVIGVGLILLCAVKPVFGSTAMKGGFEIGEAQKMLALCINLNGDGLTIDADKQVPSDWESIFDSDPKRNEKAQGFGPFDNRWKLWKNKKQDGVYALVIRGTIPSRDSIKEDLLATSIPAKGIQLLDTDQNPLGKKRGVVFSLAKTDHAEVHVGFAYGLAVMLFDRDRGILNQLSQLPAGSQIYITGHSQGAALATLAHAFLNHALTGSDDKNSFGLKGKNFSLKSYVFAQPKPGNWQFAMDFAEGIGNQDLAYTINNTSDWVPQVPLSIQLVSETLQPIATASGHWFANSALNFLARIRRSASSQVSKLTNYKENITKNFDDRYFVDAGQFSQTGYGGSSLDYMPVGNLRAFRPKNDMKAGDGDLFWEHHLARYKELLDALQKAK